MEMCFLSFCILEMDSKRRIRAPPDGDVIITNQTIRTKKLKCRGSACGCQDVLVRNGLK